MSKKAESYLAEGQKALDHKGLFGFVKSPKFDEAADWFTKAGNAFKLDNLWKSAGDSFLRSADAWSKSGDNRTDEINSLVEAASCYKKIDPVEAVKTFQKAIEMYKEAGRFGMAAKYLKEIAETFEADNNKGAAASAYEEAADMFDKDNKKSNGNTCLAKVATLLSENGDYLKAANIFEKIGKDSLSNKLSSYSAKNYFQQCLFCCLALGDTVQVSNKLEDFKNNDFTFSSSRECDFVSKLLKVNLSFLLILFILFSFLL